MTRQELIAKAQAKGLRIIERSGHYWVGHAGRYPRQRAVEIVIRPDGTIMPTDVPADVAKRMTVAQAAKFLKLD